MLTVNWYGAKTTQGWGMPVNLKGITGNKGEKGNVGEKGNSGTDGVDGSKILSGINVPTNDIGKVGDWYIDFQSGKLYGVKTVNGWGTDFIELKKLSEIAPSKDDYTLSYDKKTLLVWVNLDIQYLDMNRYPELESVTQINKDAFIDYTNLTTLILSKNIEQIKYVGGVYYNKLINLRHVTLSDKMTEINDAFSACSALTSITIPNSIINIREYAFESCISLKTITIPSSVKYIGPFAFGNCRALTSVTIEGNQVQITQHTFMNCPNLQSIYVPAQSVDMYKQAEGWKEYANKIKPIQ
ncbi:leucine-rich repeat domain-containing protein [Capnocytophaga sp.]|uniref:leucine-rich repeat domain-containing protein n=1 Tax=Capnocytophaga sp. TaxID=44737 RepID=UPI0026DACD98|nr:leucine-rich repeat domain-containing protein [Capnocytophaga sp.]MDO5104299.1 leucine-rich repeat domain-containing protein [Capnocytophaga sp.]